MNGVRRHDRRYGRPPNPALGVGVILVLASLLGGCVDAPTEQAPGDPPRAYSANIALNFPHLVNATEADGGLWLSIVLRDCPFPETPAAPVQSVRVWDRHGLVREEIQAVDTTLMEQWYWIELPGVPPWVVAGDRYACSHPQQNFLHNITSGYSIPDHASHSLDLNVAHEFHYVAFEMHPGDLRFETSWPVSDLAWLINHADPHILEGKSAFTGTIRMYYPNGELWREDTFRFGTQNASFVPPVLMAGEYRIVVEAELPVIQPMKGIYTIRDARFYEVICEHGVEWEICS